MKLLETRAELRAARDAMPGTVGVVLTMGALHEGHASLLRIARARADRLLMTIFVNPLQFGPNEDFDRYPRTLEKDLEIAAAEGVDAVFAPAREEVYPGGEPSMRVNPGPLGEVLEGASRPGFFHGVLTVVLKLLNLTRADLTVFGEKDYQQVTLVRAMVRDLDLGVRVIGAPVVREPDGLALSSRNRYLSPPQRSAALALSRALRAGAAEVSAGAAEPKAGAAEASAGAAEPKAEATAEAVLRAARGVVDGEPEVKLDYLVLTDPDLGPAPAHGAARLLIAGWVGSTRLIDNTPVEL
jgi:pantoate--beta-alanine ligase